MFVYDNVFHTFFNVVDNVNVTRKKSRALKFFLINILNYIYNKEMN